MTDIKDRIFILRTENSLTQEQMAKIFKVGISTISMWEKGERIPRPKLLQELCDYFNVDMDYLMGRSDIKNRYQAGLKYEWEDKKEEKSNFNIDTINTDYMMVPLYESISAGYGASNSEFIKMIPVFGLKKNGTTYFAVKVEGDSMEPKIPNGSTIIIKKDIAIEVGEIGAFNLNDENFVKQKKLVKDKLILHSFNLAYEDKVVNEFDDFKEYGKVVKVMIDL